MSRVAALKIPPEDIKGLENLNQKADKTSFGVLLWERLPAAIGLAVI